VDLSAFAQHAAAGLSPCVHCGFCLPACPTYEVTADEADSPRGRIVLMRGLARGELAADDAALGYHLDRCLGCRACESVCPSGVLFGPALEAARARVARARRLPFGTRAMLWVLATPRRQRLLWLAARLLRTTGIPRFLARGAGGAGGTNGTGGGAPKLARMMAMLAATEPMRLGTGGMMRPPSPSPSPPAPLSAALFRGCVMDGLFGHVHDATVAALAANGIATTEVRGQVCCGALAAHAGHEDLARDLARRNVRAFDAAAPGGPIVVNSAGCGAMLKAYGDWLAGEPLEPRARALAARVRDVSESLAAAGPARGTAALAVRVAYDAPCHLLHAQRVDRPPHQLLGAVPGLAEVPLEGSERCCGGAGIYTLVEPELSDEVLARKLDAIAAAGADVVATGNPGCQMQIGAGLLLRGDDTPVCHPVELLARSYRP
jgi:glycolate oxidase iron-sulfur subunit